MAEIRNLTRNGETFYPLTCTDAVVDRDGNPLEIVNDIFDISEYNASGTPPTLATYSTLALALAAVPQSRQKGGMTIRYVQTYDNKYVQYRLMSTSWSANISDWAICSDEILIENPEFIKVYTDKNDRILWAIKADGTVFFGAGVPPQVIEYISTYGYNKEVINELLSGKVSTETGKSLINKEYADGVDYVENPEFIKVYTDAEDKILWAIQKNGNVVFGAGVPQQIIDYIEQKIIYSDQTIKQYLDDIYGYYTDNPEWVEIKKDKNDNIISGHNKDGVLFENVGIETPNLKTDSIELSEEGLKELKENLSIKVEGVPSETSVNFAEVNDYTEEWNIQKLMDKTLETVENQLYFNADNILSELNPIGNRKLNIALITDTHQGGTRVIKRVVESARAITMWNKLIDNELIDVGVHCGDLITDYGTDREMVYNLFRYVKTLLYKGNKSLLMAKGNHDANNNTMVAVDITKPLDWKNSKYYIDANGVKEWKRIKKDEWDYCEQLYLYYADEEEYASKGYYFPDSIFSKMFQLNKPANSVVDSNNKGGCYYYSDFDDYKVRVVVLNSYQVDSNGNLNNEYINGLQYSWFAKNALNLSDKDNPSDWGIITIRHNSMNVSEIACDIINAFQDGSSISGSYGGVDYSFDYSSQGAGSFIANLHGHDHMTDYSHRKGFNDIGFDDCMTKENDFATNLAYRVHMVSIDTQNRKVYINMVSGTDEEGHSGYREYNY